MPTVAHSTCFFTDDRSSLFHITRHVEKHGGDALLWVSLVAAQRDFSRRAEALIRTTARSSEWEVFKGM